MDPQRTYDDMMQAMMDGDMEAAVYHALNLRSWKGYKELKWDRASRNVILLGSY